ncbi:GIY-YIG nuclease family protein [Bacillus sp. EAC]|uniref:GIY-YIG nuclease family protein n=1 Tax=Bacillus sp. EAC TaxID=1978338 RepID=UPI000B43FC23|nr:GIY-YIG nuclease family protein [Bacillus sp. EAC]
MEAEGIIGKHDNNKRLTDDQVREIRLKFMDGIPNVEIMEEYKIAKKTTSNIKLMITHQHVIIEGYDVEEIKNKKRAKRKWYISNQTTSNWKVKGIIYRATNTVNGKMYIGQTVKTLQVRMVNHRSDAMGKVSKSNYHFHRAIRRYEFEAFEWEVIDEADNYEDLNEKEKYWIDYYDTFNNGYNMTVGGEGSNGYIITEEDTLKRIKSQGVKPFILFDTEGNIKGEYEVVKWVEKELEIPSGGIFSTLYNTAFSTTSYNGTTYSAIYTDDFTHLAMWERIYKINNPHKARGEDSAMAKLTEKQVLEIIDLILDGFSYKEISNKYDIHVNTISSIAKRENWSHVKLSIDIAKRLQELIERNREVYGHLSDEEVREMRLNFMDGATIEEMTQEYEMSEKAIRDIRDMCSYTHVVIEGYDVDFIKAIHMKVPPQMREEIREQLMQGELKQFEIANIYDVHTTTVERIRKEMVLEGIEPPSRIGKIIEKIKTYLLEGKLMNIEIAEKCGVHPQMVSNLKMKMISGGIVIKSPPRPLSSQTEQIRELLKRGVNAQEIADTFNMNVSNVYKKKRAMQKEGIIPPSRDMAKVAEKIRELILQGVTQRATAKATGASRKTVQKVKKRIQEEGIKLQSRDKDKIKEEVRELLKQGFVQKRVAEICGVSLATVEREKRKMRDEGIAI